LCQRIQEKPAITGVRWVQAIATRDQRIMHILQNSSDFGDVRCVIARAAEIEDCRQESRIAGVNVKDEKTTLRAPRGRDDLHLDPDHDVQVRR
jgi:hypothetical protein